MLSGPCRYLEHVHKVHTKFSRDLSKEVSAQNMRLCQNIRTWFWVSFFQNLNFFHFSWHVIWLVCRVVTMFVLKQTSRLDVTFKVLEFVRKVYRQFYRVEKRFHLKKWGRNEAQKWSRNILTTPHFLSRNFLSKTSRNFFVGFTTMFEVCEKFTKLKSLRQ